MVASAIEICDVHSLNLDMQSLDCKVVFSRGCTSIPHLCWHARIWYQITESEYHIVHLKEPPHLKHSFFNCDSQHELTFKRTI